MVNYINKIFSDVIAGKDLSNFSIAKEMKKGLGRALVDGLVLEPNISGVGYNFNSLIDYFRKKSWELKTLYTFQPWQPPKKKLK